MYKLLTEHDLLPAEQPLGLHTADNSKLMAIMVLHQHHHPACNTQQHTFLPHGIPHIQMNSIFAHTGIGS